MTEPLEHLKILIIASRRQQGRPPVPQGLHRRTRPPRRASRLRVAISGADRVITAQLPIRKRQTYPQKRQFVAFDSVMPSLAPKKIDAPAARARSGR